MRHVWSGRRAFALSVLALTLSCDDQPPLAPAIPAPFFSTAALSPVRISEFHYDNTGTDAGEAIEISGPAGVDVSGWQIVLYNGNGGASYNAVTLASIIPATCGSRGVVVTTYPVNGIQNGDPDGIALVDAVGAVVEAFSYEGSFTATTGPATGLILPDIGVREAGTETVGQSLKRNGAGVWSGPAAANFGGCNDDDEPPPPAEVVDVHVTPASATVAEGGTQQFTATAFDAANQPIAGVTFTWNSTDPAIATVNASGLATGVTPGDADIIATAPNGVGGAAALHVNAAPPPGLPDTRFSEIHYDNAGTDAGEAIEVEGPARTNLDGWIVALYNGNGGAAYNTRALTGTIPDLCDGRGVVVLTYPQDGVQNGSPDGFALVDAGGQLVEFLSYEGAFTATDGPAAGRLSNDIGATEASSSPIGQSLQRDASNVWTLATASFGGCNGGAPPPPVNTITFSGRIPSDPPLPVGFEDQIFATLRDGAGATVVTTFTWTVETPTIASIDQNGVMTALGEGTATIRATAAEGTSATFSLPTRVAVAGTTAEYAGNAEFGEPADGDPTDDFILRHPQFTSSFSHIRGTPNWVSYDLDATHFGPEDRCDCFTYDPALPASFTRFTTADYTGAGAFHGYGIDRGHLARSFDRTTGSLDNAFTFLFSNIIPQAADNNQGPWSDLEFYLGDLARFANKEVYIVAGVAGSKGTVKDEGKIVIPSHTWKVALVLPRDRGLADIQTYQDIEEVVAAIMPNDPGIRNVDWTLAYKTTVDAVEALSGYDLLALLPDNIERIVEANDHPPVASAGGPYTGFEGSAVTFDASGSNDPDAGDALAFAWDFGDGSTGTGLAPSHTYADNGTYPVSLTVTDSYGATATANSSVSVTNLAPVMDNLAVPAGPIRVGTAATVSVSFTDAGADDTHVTTINWGDGTTSTTASHAYAAPGLYSISATVTDDDGGATSAAAPSYVVVYDPHGMAAGAGWIGTGRNRALFAFQARYLPHRDRPFAVLEFFTGTALFSATSVDWLVVNDNKAILRGAGAIGRVRGYQFLWVAVTGHPDGVRLKIWDAAGVAVYDNQPDQPDTSDAVTPLKGGTVQVRR